MGHDFARSINSSDKIFPAHVAGLDRFSGFYAGAREQYVRLTIRQLQSGLLQLYSACRGGGTVLPVQKAGGRQRLVWHGARVSEAASDPPPPRHLADPAVFGFLCLRQGAQLRVTKRDALTWFDQLWRCPSLRPFFGRPRIWRSEFLAAGVSAEDLRRFSTGCE